MLTWIGGTFSNTSEEFVHMIHQSATGTHFRLSWCGMWILDIVSILCFMLKMLEHPDLNNLNNYLIFVIQITYAWLLTVHMVT
jgi:hypothetical protein